MLGQAQERKIEKGNLNLLGYLDFDDADAIEDDAVIIDAVAKIECAVNGKPLLTRGRSGKNGDHAIDFGKSPAGKWVRIDGKDAAGHSWLKPASDFNQLSVSLWQKLHSRSASSTFWLGAESASSGDRNAQAHIPWSNGQIYWDTAGCCDGRTTRINRSWAGGLGKLPQLSVEPLAGGGGLELRTTYPAWQNPAADDVRLALELSADLRTWQLVNERSVVRLGGGVIEHRWQSQSLAIERPTLFFRLRLGKR